MSELEEKIAAWRGQLIAGGIESSAILDELESHLLEEVDIRLGCGNSEAQAFEHAVQWMGALIHSGRFAMFNLDQAIAEWRRQMAAGGNKNSTILDELESHLRDDIRTRVAAGDLEARAFELAVAKMGSPSVVRNEFNKINRPTCWPVKIGISLWMVMAVLVAGVVARQFHFGKLTPLLTVHIMALTTGYLAVFLAGAFGLYYVGMQWSGKLSPQLQLSLYRAARAFTGISAGLIVAGLFLGTIWNKQIRGVYWGGSLREIGAVCVLMWLAVLWVMERRNQQNIYLRMLACVAGNVVVSLAWFGVVILMADPGLKYLGSYWPLEIFVAIHLVILALGFSRRFETAKA